MISDVIYSETSVQVEAEGEMLALFCGREDTDTEAVPAQQVITSPRNSLSVLFSSDFSNEERYSGFMAHYSAVGEERLTVNTLNTCIQVIITALQEIRGLCNLATT